MITPTIFSRQFTIPPPSAPSLPAVHHLTAFRALSLPAVRCPSAFRASTSSTPSTPSTKSTSSRSPRPA